MRSRLQRLSAWMQRRDSLGIVLVVLLAPVVFLWPATIAGGALVPVAVVAEVDVLHDRAVGRDEDLLVDGLHASGLCGTRAVLGQLLTVDDDAAGGELLAEGAVGQDHDRPR